MLNAPMSWCKFGATLYQTIFTIFTISNGIAKTPRDNYSLDNRPSEQELNAMKARLAEELNKLL